MRFNQLRSDEQLIQEFFKFDNFKISPNGVVVYGPSQMKKMPVGDEFNNALPVKFARAIGDFTINSMDLTSLEGCPKVIEGGEFSCAYNKLTSLEGGPIAVGGDYLCHYNPLISLSGLPSMITNRIVLSYNENLPLLKLLFIKELKGIQLTGYRSITGSIISKILNKYLGTGKPGALACAAELTKAGFKGNARL